MKWDPFEIEQLRPILQQVQADLEPLEGKHILVLCSAAGEVAFWLGERMKNGHVTGLELDPALLEGSQCAAKNRGLEDVVEFLQVEKTRIPLPDGTFDGLVSEFIAFPTPAPAEIGQPEMARVLKPGGKMALTDVIVTRPVPPAIRSDLQAIGLDYLCDATPDDFRSWMTAAGLGNIKTLDFTPVVKQVWKQRRESDQLLEHQKGYADLFDDPEFRLGTAIFYIYVCGVKA